MRLYGITICKLKTVLLYPSNKSFLYIFYCVSILFKNTKVSV